MFETGLRERITRIRTEEYLQFFYFFLYRLIIQDLPMEPKIYLYYRSNKDQDIPEISTE